MTKTITQIATSDTFQVWFDRTNLTINAISTEAVTCNSHANGGLTTGNGFVEGTFGARNLVGNTIHGGTVQTPALLTCTSNLAVTGDNITVGVVTINSSSVAYSGIPLQTGSGKISTNTSGTSAQQIDFFDKILYRAAEYALAIRDNNANAYQFSKILVLHDSGDAYFTNYAVVFSNTAQGDFSANANSTHIRVFLTPISTNTHVSGTKVTVDI
jgi:hypothetical protein